MNLSKPFTKSLLCEEGGADADRALCPLNPSCQLHLLLFSHQKLYRNKQPAPCSLTGSGRLGSGVGGQRPGITGKLSVQLPLCLLLTVWLEKSVTLPVPPTKRTNQSAYSLGLRGVKVFIYVTSQKNVHDTWKASNTYQQKW